MCIYFIAWISYALRTMNLVKKLFGRQARHVAEWKSLPGVSSLIISY